MPLTEVLKPSVEGFPPVVVLASRSRNATYEAGNEVICPKTACLTSVLPCSASCAIPTWARSTDGLLTSPMESVRRSERTSPGTSAIGGSHTLLPVWTAIARVRLTWSGVKDTDGTALTQPAVIKVSGNEH